MGKKIYNFVTKDLESALFSKNIINSFRTGPAGDSGVANLSPVWILDEEGHPILDETDGKLYEE